MTKHQRTRARIKRDMATKEQKRKKLYARNDNFKSVVTRQHYIEALAKCRKGVSWKGSVQSYTEHAIIEINKVIDSLYRGVLPELTSVRHIELYERGKRRIIVPITIRDRMTQRVLCDYALTPMLERTLIYDNGASMKGKGVEFTRKRVDKHLKEAIKEYGPNFYALVFDFKSFFDSVPHKTCLDVLNKHFQDRYIKGLTMAIIRSYQKSTIKNMADKDERDRLIHIIDNNLSKGICLGSQISQIMALVTPNKLDHYIKDQVGVKHYLRYMDDGIVLSNDKEFLHRLYSEMIKVCKELGLTFNERKTKIVRISKGFMFLKVRYRVSPTGKIIRTLAKSGAVRMRRKLKKYTRLVQNGEMSMDDIYNSIQSWVAHSKIAMSYRTRKSMLRLYNELFGGYRITKKYNHCKGGKNGELLQTDRWQHLRWCCDAA